MKNCSLTFWCFLLTVSNYDITHDISHGKQVVRRFANWPSCKAVKVAIPCRRWGGNLSGECEKCWKKTMKFHKACFNCNLAWSNIRLGQQVYDPIGFDKVMILIWWLIPLDTCRINLNSGNGLKHWYPPPVKKDKCDSYFGSFINEKKRAILVPRCFWTVPTSPDFRGGTNSLGNLRRVVTSIVTLIFVDWVLVN